MNISHELQSPRPNHPALTLNTTSNQQTSHHSSSQINATPVSQEHQKRPSVDSSAGPGSAQTNNDQIQLWKTPTVEQKPSPTGQIPNGGSAAWLVVLGSFFLNFNTWGNNVSFGAYQDYYETGEQFHASSSQIAWIGSTQACLLLFVGALIGPIYDLGYLRFLLITGSVAVVFGQMMTSLAQAYWVALVAQGFCIGIGSGFLWIPSIAIIAQWFNTRNGLAVGIATTGSGLAGILYSIMFHRLQSSIGFAWATRIIGFVQLATLAVPIATVRMRVTPPKVRSMIDWSAFREVPWLLYTISCFIVLMGLYVPYFYIQYFAGATHTTDANTAFYLLAIMNTGSIPGRVLPNYLGDRFGPFNMLVFCCPMMGLLILTLISQPSFGGLVVFCIFYGFFSGMWLSLPGPTIIKLCPSPAVIGTRMGMTFAVASFGLLIGNPIGGAILKSGTEEEFQRVWAFGGVMVLVAGVGYVVTRMLKAGWKLAAIV